MYVEYITIGLHFEDNKTDVTMYLSKKKKKRQAYSLRTTELGKRSTKELQVN